MYTAEQKIKNKIYQFIAWEIRKELSHCSTDTLSEKYIKDDLKIEDLCNEVPNKYDEHLFVYLHGYGLKEKYSEDKHVDIVLSHWEEACNHIDHLLFISPSNIIFVNKLYELITNSKLREKTLENAIVFISKTGQDLKITYRYSERVMNAIIDNIRILMIKSLILHLYKSLNKSKIAINNIVCNLLDINYKFFDQNFAQLEDEEEIDNIRDPKLYASKEISLKPKEPNKIKVKTIEIKYQGFDDLLQNMLDILWDEYNAVNGGDITNSELFAEYSEQINSRFNYNTYVQGFRTWEQIALQVSNPNSLNNDPNIATHDDMLEIISSIEQNIENDPRLDINFVDDFNKITIDGDTYWDYDHFNHKIDFE